MPGFCLFYAVHGVLREREYELYCVIVAILIVSVYVVVNYFISTPNSSMIKKVWVDIIIYQKDTAADNQLNFNVKKKPQTTNYVLHRLQAHFID